MQGFSVRLLLLFLGCITWANATRAQQGVVDFYVDPVGKVYFLRTDDRLVTDNPLGQNEFDFYDSSLGAPGLVDVTNPFAILLFYPDYGEVIVLDRTLSELSRLDLFSLPDVLQPSLLARSADNQIWVFDSWDYRLKLIDETGRLGQESNDLRLEINLQTPPDHLYVDRDRVMLHFAEDQKLAVFTNYGRFTGWVPLKPADYLRWQAPVLYGQSEEEAWLWRSGQGEIDPLTLPREAQSLHLLRAGKTEFWGLDSTTARVKKIPFRRVGGE
jgi:hypothetical protein